VVIAHALVGCWQDGHLVGLQFDELDFEEAPPSNSPP
jgi:hypothetical protein